MKRYLAVAVLGVALMGASCDQGKITPAESVMLTCEQYPIVLTRLAEANAAGKINDSTEKIVDGAIDILDPICTGPAPNVDAKLKDVAVDAGMRSLNAVLAAIF